MLKIAVIGAGRHSALHHGPVCRHFKDRIELAAVCDVNIDAARKYARNFKFKSTFTSYSEMIREVKPDAIIAVTPEKMTRKIVGDLIPYGIPVLMEKPIGNNLKDATELCDLATRSSAQIMVSFNRRFAPMISPALKWLEENTEKAAPQMFMASILRHDRHEANFLSATAIHPLDVMISVMGMPSQINIKKSAGEIGREPVTMVNMAFPGGAIAGLMVAPDCGRVEEKYEIIGEGYCLKIDYFKSLEIWRSGKQELELKLDLSSPLEEREGAIAEMAYFLDCVAGKNPFSPGIHDGLNMAILGDKILKAG